LDEFAMCTPLIGFRTDPEICAAIVRWAEKQPDNPSLSEAVYRPVTLGLTVRTKSKQVPTARAGRAKELASKAIDKLMAGAPDDDVKASRKGCLIKGPKEFREDRVDLPKVENERAKAG
jgi:hypothetical protein